MSLDKTEERRKAVAEKNRQYMKNNPDQLFLPQYWYPISRPFVRQHFPALQALRQPKDKTQFGQSLPVKAAI